MNVNQDRDDGGGARGHLGDPPAVRGRALQPSEEHLAVAEVHLKLVNAHLAALDVAESTEAGPMGTVAPPPPEPSGGETDVGRTEVVPT